MVFSISQEAFNEAVQENINDLGLSPDEALTEAIDQFKAQGVDLSQLITDPSALASLETIKSALEKIKENATIENLDVLKAECSKGIQYKVQAGRAGAYRVLLDVFNKETIANDLKLAAGKTLVVLLTKQPDLIDEQGIETILSNVDSDTDIEVKRIVLKMAKEACIMHEMNRQRLFDLHLVDKLTTLLMNKDNLPVLKDILAVYRALILDDDVRVEFGRAHEHARVIASETLIPITDLLRDCKSEESLVIDLMLTLSALLVRAEFCLKVEEAGGLDLIKDLMVTYIENDNITRQCFKLIKALAGNDECKAKIIQKGFAPIISNSLNTYKNSIPTATAGLHCIAALSLRNAENSKALFEASAPDVIIDIMKAFPDEKAVQKTASWAVRNMVSRSRYQNKYFLELGIEDLLHTNLSKFKEFEYDIKAALRDLECNVELKEEWTGKGGQITTENA